MVTQAEMKPQFALREITPRTSDFIHLRKVAGGDPYPRVQRQLVGFGPELSKLRAMVKEKEIEKNIEFTGLLSRPEIFELMKRSKILVHPSKFEGFGYVFAEALVNGMNIVSFNVGCTQKHLKWFIAKDEQDFINITQNLLTTKLNFTPVNLFPLDKTVENYASIYGIK